MHLAVLLAAESVSVKAKNPIVPETKEIVWAVISFAIITAALWSLKVVVVIWPVSLALLIGLTGFEVLVAVLQAFIFTILTAVYIGGAMHPEH